MDLSLASVNKAFAVPIAGGLLREYAWVRQKMCEKENALCRH